MKFLGEEVKNTHYIRTQRYNTGQQAFTIMYKKSIMYKLNGETPKHWIVSHALIIVTFSKSGSGWE